MRAPAVGVRESEVSPGAIFRLTSLRRRDVPLFRLDAVHLTADVRPIAPVEAEHRRKRLVVRNLLEVEADELVGEPAISAELEVHRQKGDVGGHVAKPDAVVELDAVHDADAAFRPDDNGVRTQVTVAIAHTAGIGAAIHQRPVLLEEAIHVATDGIVLLMGDRPVHELPRLLEVLIPVPPDGICPAEGGDARIRLRARVEVSERGGERPHLLLTHVVLREESRHHPLRRHAPHAHGVFDHFPGAPDVVRAGMVASNRCDAQVDAVAESAVEAHLFLAHQPPPLQGAVIKEAKVERLLDLVRELAREEHVRDMRLDQLDVVDVMIVCPPLEQSAHVFGQGNLRQFKPPFGCAARSTGAGILNAIRFSGESFCRAR